MENPRVPMSDSEPLRPHTDMDARMEAGEPYSGDAKRTDAMHEMLSVRNLAHRTYYQCLCIFMMIGITLVVVIAQNPYRYYVPVASHLIGYGGVVAYLLVMMALLSCGRDASTRFGLVITVTMLLGVGLGFLFGINITLSAWLNASGTPGVSGASGASDASGASGRSNGV